LSYSRNKKGQFKKGTVPWNKGLTKYDHPNIMFHSKRMSSYNKNHKMPKGQNNPNYKGGKPKCIDCGKKLTNYTIKNGKPNLRCVDCYWKFAIGKNSPTWRGGISKIPYPFSFTKKLKEKVKKRDNYKCILCVILNEKIKHKNLSVHHIDYDKQNINPINLLTLCRKHNTLVNFNRKYWKQYFKTIMKRKKEK